MKSYIKELIVDQFVGVKTWSLVLRRQTDYGHVGRTDIWNIMWDIEKECVFSLFLRTYQARAKRGLFTN